MPSGDEPLSCYKCGFETNEQMKDCPECGQYLRTAVQVRRLGWVLAGTGVFLLLFMTGLIVLIAYIIAHTDKPGATVTFSGDTLDAAMVFGILGLVWLFGLTGLVGGIWQIRHGRRNKKLTRIIIWLGLAFLVIGTIIQILD